MRNLLLHFRETMPAWPEGYNKLYGPKLDSSQNKCIKEMHDSCSIVDLLKEKDGKIIAALGIL